VTPTPNSSHGGPGLRSRRGRGDDDPTQRLGGGQILRLAEESRSRSQLTWRGLMEDGSHDLTEESPIPVGGVEDSVQHDSAVDSRSRHDGSPMESTTCGTPVRVRREVGREENCFRVWGSQRCGLK
jgi:hypothetical protein